MGQEQPGQQPGYAAGGYGEPAPSYGYGPPPAAAERPADLGIRFLARLIDFIILGVVAQIIDRILLQGMFNLNAGNGLGVSAGSIYAYSAISGVITAAIYLAYFVLMESRNGQTLGKMLLKLRTEGPGGGPPSTEVALRRNFWVGLGALAVIPFGGVIGGIAELVIIIMIAVTISQSPVREGWHDRFAGGSRVVRTG
jgi:uncharacterized RDD family membrane protein YckC